MDTTTRIIEQTAERIARERVEVQIEEWIRTAAPAARVILSLAAQRLPGCLALSDCQAAVSRAGRTAPVMIGAPYRAAVRGWQRGLLAGLGN